MLFILVINLSGNGILSTFDNTAMINPKPDQLTPCQIISTEHFSQTKGDYSEGRLALHSSRIINANCQTLVIPFTCRREHLL